MPGGYTGELPVFLGSGGRGKEKRRQGALDEVMAMLRPSEKSQRRVMKCDEYDRDSAGSVKVVQDRGDGRIQKRFSDRKRWHTGMGDRANGSARNRTVSSDVILLSIA